MKLLTKLLLILFKMVFNRFNETGKFTTNAIKVLEEFKTKSYFILFAVAAIAYQARHVTCRIVQVTRPSSLRFQPFFYQSLRDMRITDLLT